MLYEYKLSKEFIEKISAMYDEEYLPNESN